MLIESTTWVSNLSPNLWLYDKTGEEKVGPLTSPMLPPLNLGTVMLRHAYKEIDKEQREVAYPKRVSGNIFQPAVRVEGEE